MNLWSFNIFRFFYCCKKKDDTSDVVALEERIDDVVVLTNPTIIDRPIQDETYVIREEIIELKDFKDENIKEFIEDIHDKLIQYFILASKTIEDLERNCVTDFKLIKCYLNKEKGFNSGWVVALVLKSFTVLNLIEKCGELDEFAGEKSSKLFLYLNDLKNATDLIKKHFEQKPHEHVEKMLEYYIIDFYLILKEAVRLN